MTPPFIPYWLIHEPGKTWGFATVDLEAAITAERAVEVWRELAEPLTLDLFHGLEIAARLITEPMPV